MGNEQSGEDVPQNETLLQKQENGEVNSSVHIISHGTDTDVVSETLPPQNEEPPSLILNTETNDPVVETVEPDSTHVDAQLIPEVPDKTTHVEEASKSKGKKSKLFGKMFKKKDAPATDVKSVEESEIPDEAEVDGCLPTTDLQLETDNLKQESQSLPEPESQDPDPKEEQAPDTDNGNSEVEESEEDGGAEENTVMNFFKTLVTPAKTPKKETATGDATKDQSQKESQPAATVTAAQASDPSVAPKAVPVPPPAPPEPPKVEIKGEPPAKSTKPTPKEEPKAAAKEPESSKGISTKIKFGSLFRPKTITEASQAVVDIKEALLNGPEPDAEDQSENNVTLQEIAEDLLQLVVGDQMGEESPQPVVEPEKPDASKTGTLEAAAKLEPPPPAQEEKKAPPKKSLFSAFKSKTAEAKKQTPAPPPEAEAAQAAKSREEPKAAAKTVEAAVDNKAASGATKPGDDAAKVPVKQEKTNSKQFLFKLLQQKRPSTDAGVQTESVTAAPATEKAK